ncbi:hypothetical protein [Actinacidiphila acididurans]|uniref:CorA-like Mg2+ transporter protein n=1 Tax=Actinacidiphila acididurans TaxID=2784346 RepID=A0ABS2THW9_9ACTN|nr:hypothetical protein [Actinacidiphila acididurans]MBM9502949.1 hypothetical protein [Actinacidiphila acididurans]
MSDVLHLQTRAYPLHHRAPGTAFESIAVPGHGELRPFAGGLRSLAYNPDSTIEVDLTSIVRPAITVPGAEIVACHARILIAGTVLVIYALRHETDVRRLALPELDALDAAVNRVLREADAPVLTAVLSASLSSGLLGNVALRPDLALDGDRSPIDRQSARYNCHFVTQDPPWQADARVPTLISGPDCRILLPYTYAWDRDPATPLQDLLTMTEPTDIAVAQQSLLVGALIAGRWVLTHLAHGHPETTDVPAFRRFLDGLWADFHHLDGYRIESIQAHRANYLAARQVIGLDDTQERADKLLGYVSNSLVAASSMRAEALDTRLNRLAAALAVVSAASFGLDIAVFVLPNVSLAAKLGVVTGLIGMAAACLMAVIVPGRSALHSPSASRRLGWSPRRRQVVPPPRHPAGEGVPVVPATDEA